MELHLTHALILTQFEASLSPHEFETVCEQDYTVHAIYCQETKSLIYHSEPRKFNGFEEITVIKKVLANLPISVLWNKQILILEDQENEYSSSDVLKHFR